MYRVYTIVNYADTIRDPDHIVVQELAICEDATTAVKFMKKFIAEKFLVPSGSPIMGNEDGTKFVAYDSGSWAKTLIAEKSKIVRKKDL